jgi:hypothetical protein
MTLVNSLSISSIRSGWANPLSVLSVIMSICQIQKIKPFTESTTLDIVTRTLRNLLHHFEHSRNSPLQDFRLFVDDLVCDLVRKEQNALQPLQKFRRHLVIPVLFLQELIESGVTSASGAQERIRTSNVTWATPKAACAIPFN